MPDNEPIEGYDTPATSYPDSGYGDTPGSQWTPQRIASKRGNILELVVQQVVLAITGFLTNGSAFTQLRNWGQDIANRLAGVVNHFADILTGLGLGTIADWITDLLGTRGTASTALTNAQAALGQITQFLTAAGHDTMLTLGNAFRDTVLTFSNILNGLGLSSISDWILDLLGIKNTANTAAANASNALGQFTQMLAAAGQNTVTTLGNAVKGTVNNFADILSGFGLSSVANWITDLLGTRSTAGTASTNASNALGQLSQMITNAAAGTAATLGNMLAQAKAGADQAILNFTNILSGMGMSSIANLILDWTGTRSTATTANTNANAANAGLATANTKLAAKIRAADEMVLDPQFETPAIWQYETQGNAMSTDIALTGTYSRKLTGHADPVFYLTAAGSTPTPTWAIRPGQRFYFAAWVWKPAGHDNVGNFRIQNRIKVSGSSNDAYPNIVQVAMSAIPAEQWTLIEGVYNVPELSTVTGGTFPPIAMMPRVYVQGANSSQAVYVGRVSVKDVTDAQNLLDKVWEGLTGGVVTTFKNLTDAKNAASGVKATSDTASTNATNALGQLTQLISNAGQSLASGVGSMLAQAAENTRLTLLNLWQGLTGSSSTADRTPAEVKTASAAVKSTADTAGTNATTANAGVGGLRNGYRTMARASNNLASDPDAETPEMWSQLETGTTFCAPSTEDSYAGTTSLKIITSGSGTPLISMLRDVQGSRQLYAPVKAGDRVAVSAMVKQMQAYTSGGRIRINFVFRDSKGVNPATANPNPTTVALPVGAFTEMTHVATVPVGYDEVMPRINFSGVPVAGDVYFVDRMVFEQYTRTQSVITKLWEAFTGGTATTDPLDTLLKNVAAAVKSTSDTAGTNANNALGQLSALVSNAGQSLASGVGTMLATAAENTRLTLTRLWEGLTGQTATGDKTPAEVKTASAAVKSTSETASTNAATAGANANNALTSAVAALTGYRAATRAGANLVRDPGFEDPNAWVDAGGELSTEQKRSGTSSMRMQHYGGYYYPLYLINDGTGPVPLIVKPGDVFEIEVNLRPAAGNPAGGTHLVGINVTDSTGALEPAYVNAGSPAVPTSSSNWTAKLNGRVEVPAGYDRAAPIYQLNNDVGAGFVMYVDDASVLRITEAAHAQLSLATLVTNAGQTVIGGVGTAIANVVTRAQQTLNALWEGLTGGFGGNRSEAEVRTAAAGVKSISDTAGTNASTALTNGQDIVKGIVNAWRGGTSSSGATAEVAPVIQEIKDMLQGGYTVQTITSNTTWTKPANLAECVVILMPSGRNGSQGGTYKGNPGGTALGGAGGKGGAFVVQEIPVDDIPATVPVTIGAAGSAAGNPTSFGSLLTVTVGALGGVSTKFGFAETTSGAGDGGRGGGMVFQQSQTDGETGKGSATAGGGAGGSTSVGSAGNVNPTAGQPGSAANVAQLTKCGGGGGGGGGGAGNTTFGNNAIGQTGGAGGYPAGGGGGGGAAAVSTSGNTATGGAGGPGAAGIAWIFTRTAA